MTSPLCPACYFNLLAEEAESVKHKVCIFIIRVQKASLPLPFFKSQTYLIPSFMLHVVFLGGATAAQPSVLPFAATVHLGS